MSDVESSIWRGWAPELFQFSTGDRRELYIALLLAFHRASELQPTLGIDDVVGALAEHGWREPVGDELLHSALLALVGWGLLESTQDHAARYSTPEEFERRNLRWAMTQRGQAAASGVLAAHEALRRTASLQPAVIDAMADGVRELQLLARGADIDPRRAFARVREIESHLESLVDNVRQFNRHLQRLLREDATSDEVFADVKGRTLEYLQNYVDEVDQPARRLADGITSFRDDDLRRALDAALEGANLPPDADDTTAREWLAARERRWQALRAWFAPTTAEAPRIETLQGVAVHAIVQLTRVLDRRMTARRRATSTADDFRVLARWFGAAPNEAAAHRLFNAAFGAWPSRHAHVLEADEGDVSRTTSWLDAPPAVIAPQLRTSGTTALRGRVKPVGDPASLRALRQRRQAEQLQRATAVRARLATDGLVRISSAFEQLDPAAFAELLALIGQALSGERASDGRRRATSIDGQVEVVLDDPRDGATALVRTDHGELLTPDFALHIEVLGVDALSESRDRDREIAAHA